MFPKTRHPGWRHVLYPKIFLPWSLSLSTKANPYTHGKNKPYVQKKNPSAEKLCATVLYVKGAIERMYEECQVFEV